MSKLIKKISDKCKEKQLIITTHSTFVLNKLGIEKAILLSKNENLINHTLLNDLSEDTQKYFKKLPGYDTLRLLLAKKAILVEGPSDELFVQKGYKIKHGKLPIEEGIDIISVSGLSFKRFLELAKKLKKEVAVVTDNDGDYENKVENKYKDFLSLSNIKICYDKNNACKTLEMQIVECNELELLNNVLGRKDSSKEELVKYMKENKTECAMKFFDTNEIIKTPKYIQDAIQ
jgi:predicted ATP-dependent endonuclease of OLD family